MVVIGLTGNIGSGKSEVARILQQEGAVVLSSDETAHQLMENDPTLRAQLRQIVGADAVPEHGPLNRSAIARAIFGPTPDHAKRRRELERCVHPRVLESIARQLNALATQNIPLVFVESALIYEAGIEDLFDYVVAIVASEEVRRARVQHRSPDALFTLRQQTQLSDAELRERADFVISNDGTLEELKAAARTFLAIARSLPPRPVTSTVHSQL